VTAPREVTAETLMDEVDGTVLASFAHERTGDSWRLRRDPTGALQLDSISRRSLDRGLCWAYCGPVIDERIGSGPTPDRALECLIEAVVRFMRGVEAADQHHNAINARKGK
jgi:hypothetical protein